MERGEPTTQHRTQHQTPPRRSMRLLLVVGGTTGRGRIAKLFERCVRHILLDQSVRHATLHALDGVRAQPGGEFAAAEFARTFERCWRRNQGERRMAKRRENKLTIHDQLLEPLEGAGEHHGVIVGDRSNVVARQI